MLYREIMAQLIEWKNRKHHPLIVSGLRQVGKTYIIKEFGKEQYENVVYIDLRKEVNLHSAFSGDFNIDDIIFSITAKRLDAVFIPNKTLIIFDEIQDCPDARSSLKYWDIDGRYDVIASGSFLGVKGFRTIYKRGIPVGYEEEIQMTPMTFREFLINQSMPKDIYDKAVEYISDKKTIPQSLNETLLDYYKKYLMIGGMPEVVSSYISDKNMGRIRRIQQNIIHSIMDDFGRYKDAKGNDKINEKLKLKATKALQSLPAQLSKEYKKFQYSLMDYKGSSDEKSDGIEYLIDVGLVIPAYNLKEIAFPLEGLKKDNEFKLYLADTGLLCAMLEEDIYAAVLDNILGAYKGAMAENMVAVALRNKHKSLYYYRDKTGSPEIDFVTAINNKLTIIETKASNGASTSFNFVLTHPNRFGKLDGIKLINGNIGVANAFVSLPLYALELMKENTIVNLE